MEKIFSRGTLYYIPDLSGDRQIIQEPSFQPRWVLSFALRQSDWQISNYSDNLINLFIKTKNAPFLLIILSENPYTEWRIEQIPKEGHLSVPMIHTIFNILKSISDKKPDSSTSLEIYINLLLVYLKGSPEPKSSFRFHELQIIYNVVYATNNAKSASYPAVRKLIHDSQIPAHRFQRACLEMFGSSLQSLIQYEKMKLAFDDIVKNNKTRTSIAKTAGFKHYENFSTRFREYFGVKPTIASSFYGGF